MSSIRSLHLVALPALLLALGCASTQTPEPEATLSEPEPMPAPMRERTTTSMTLDPVYFDFDNAQLRPEARKALARYAKAILDHPEWGSIRVEGHCDERGSGEYNLALGSRRASGVKRYLMDSGVPASRLTTQSYGEEKPAVRGHGEAAWRYNRRSELQVDALASER